METKPELSISLVEVKQEILEDFDDEQDDIIKSVLSEHDYVFVKREAEYDTPTTLKSEEPSIEIHTEDNEEGEDEEEEMEDDDMEEDMDKIQAAKTLAELSILPVMMSEARSERRCVELPDLRRTSQSLSLRSGGQKYSCNICGKEYSTSSNLARHRQTHRSPDHSKARRCHLCNKVYVSMPAFSMHMRTHSAGHNCHVCGKTFSRPWLLKGHMRTHTGEKPYNCPVCSKSFSDKSNLRAHLQTHSAVRPFMCLKCGKNFALKSYLVKHRETSSCENEHFITTNKTDGKSLNKNLVLVESQ